MIEATVDLANGPGCTIIRIIGSSDQRGNGWTLFLLILYFTLQRAHVIGHTRNLTGDKFSKLYEAGENGNAGLLLPLSLQMRHSGGIKIIGQLMSARLLEGYSFNDGE